MHLYKCESWSKGASLHEKKKNSKGRFDLFVKWRFQTECIQIRQSVHITIDISPVNAPPLVFWDFEIFKKLDQIWQWNCNFCWASSSIIFLFAIRGTKSIVPIWSCISFQFDLTINSIIIYQLLIVISITFLRQVYYQWMYDTISQPTAGTAQVAFFTRESAPQANLITFVEISQVPTFFFGKRETKGGICSDMDWSANWKYSYDFS